MTFQADFDLSPPDPVPEAGSFMLPLCLTESELLLLMQCVELGGLALGLGRQGDHIAPIWQALEYIDEPNQTACAVVITPPVNADNVRDNIARAMTEFSAELDEIEDEMPRHNVVNQNGQWFIQVDCGCDPAIYIPLSASVQLDGNGNPVNSTDGGEFGGGFSTGDGASGSWDGTVSSANVSCYADLAVPYLLGRCEDFLHLMVDYATIGDSIVDASESEFFDFPAALNALAFGAQNVTYVKSLAKASITAVLTNATLVESLKNGWTFTGSVNRQQLRGWVDQNCPPNVLGFSASVMMMAWLDYSIMVGYNNQLVSYASQCESGNTAPTLPFAGSTWGVVYDFTIDEQGWTVSGSADALYDTGVGWKQNLANDKTIVIAKDEPLVVTGAIITLSRAMAGDLNEIEFRTSNGGAILVTDTNTDAVMQIDVFDTFSNTLDITLHESTVNASMDNLWIEEIRLFGTGTPATDGVQFY